MLRVTNGEVVFNERAKTADFSHKDVTVRLAFSFPEDFDGDIQSAIAGVGSAAEAQAKRMLAGSVGHGAGSNGGGIVGPVADTPPAAPVEFAPRRGRPPKVGPAKPVPVVEADPSAIEEDPTAPPVATETTASDAATPAAPMTDPGAIDDEDVTVAAPIAEVITDAIIMDKTTQKNAVLKQPGKIKALIANYTSPAPGKPPPTVRDIPADKRHAYLLELDALK